METAYTYDGSLGGLLCCVFDSYTRREMPLAILTEGEPTFYRTWPVETVEAHAMRVWRSLGRLSGEIQEWVKRAGQGMDDLSVYPAGLPVWRAGNFDADQCDCLPTIQGGPDGGK